MFDVGVVDEFEKVRNGWNVDELWPREVDNSGELRRYWDLGRSGRCRPVLFVSSLDVDRSAVEPL